MLELAGNDALPWPLLCAAFPWLGALPARTAEQLRTDARYAGYLHRQQAEVRLSRREDSVDLAGVRVRGHRRPVDRNPREAEPHPPGVAWRGGPHPGHDTGGAGLDRRLRPQARGGVASTVDSVSNTSAKVPSAAGATPAMAQWFAAKADHPDALLFFRMGDFYELFFADAEAAAAALDIALSHRGEHARNADPDVRRSAPCFGNLSRAPDPARVSGRHRRADGGSEGPHRQAADQARGRPDHHAGHDHRRVAAGGRAAQPADGAGLGQGWARRRLGRCFHRTVRNRRDCDERNFRACLAGWNRWRFWRRSRSILATGQRIARPKRCRRRRLIARRRLAEAFGTASLDAFGTFSDGEAVAAAMAVDYIRSTQSGALPRLGRPEPQGQAGALLMDAATRASLEILRSRDGGTQHTLFAAVQRTLTAAGARHAGGLAVRAADGPGCDRCASGCLVLVRGQPGCGQPVARDPANGAGHGTGLGPAVAEPGNAAGSCGDPGWAEGGVRGGRGSSGAAALRRLPMPRSAMPVRFSLGGGTGASVGRPGSGAPGRRRCDPRRALTGNWMRIATLRDESRQVIAKLQLDFAQRFGVASLKIKHHAQLGYIIEAPSVAVEKLRGFPELTLRQGMANGARFTTPELSELDQRIREAAEQATARERLVFAHLVQRVLAHGDELAACADGACFSGCDAIGRETGGERHLGAAGADRRRTNSASKPGAIRWWKAHLPGQAAFVPNRCDLSPDQRVMLLTGPNMAGKSTFLRQNALFVVLAQAGLPLPAESAVLGIVDRLFSRVGAADDLARGRSTFMVEMTETAAILHQAGPKSLVVVDEIGRGTSTLDGLAIAWAVLEALHSAIRCRTIFATHFHELAELADRLPRLKPHTMRVKEWKGTVVFLHEVAEGRGGTVLGRACRGTCGRAGAGGSPGGVVDGGDGKAWRTAWASRRRSRLCHCSPRPQSPERAEPESDAFAPLLRRFERNKPG